MELPLPEPVDDRVANALLDDDDERLAELEVVGEAVEVWVAELDCVPLGVDDMDAVVEGVGVLLPVPVLDGEPPPEAELEGDGVELDELVGVAKAEVLWEGEALGVPDVVPDKEGVDV